MRFVTRSVLGKAVKVVVPVEDERKVSPGEMMI